MEEKLVVQTEEFIKKAFVANPHFSFGHWSIMYEHSMRVRDIALQIAEEVVCDKTMVTLGALLHDIGKTRRADEEILHLEHEKFNLPIAEDFINSFSLEDSKKAVLKDLISYQSQSTEMKVIKDADALALYADKRLYTLFIEWAVKNNLNSSIQRKIDKFQKLRFPVSKKIGQLWFDQMKVDWDLYLQGHR